MAYLLSDRPGRLWGWDDKTWAEVHWGGHNFRCRIIPMVRGPHLTSHLLARRSGAEWGIVAQ